MLGFSFKKRKLENVKHEMARLGINVLGTSETRWPVDDYYKSGGFTIIHSRGEDSQRGVAISPILDNKYCVEKVRYDGDRLLMVNLKGKPVDMRIIQVS